MENQLKTLVIFNPHSGSGKLTLSKEQLYQYLDPQRFALTLQITQVASEAIDLSHAAVQEGYQAVIAIGGDGTLNECAAGLWRSNLILGMIPVGSGNGLARHLGIPLQWEQALKELNQYQILPIDVCTANGIPFLNVAGLGYDAAVAHDFSQQASRGFWTYVQSAISTYRRYQPRDYKIQLRGSHFKIKALMITVANGSQFGNNAYIAPNALINDGLMDITVIHKVRTWGAFRVALQLFRKKITHSRYARHFRTPLLRIKQKGKIIHLDGEPFVLGKKVEFAVEQQALKVWVPAAFYQKHHALTLSGEPQNTA